MWDFYKDTLKKLAGYGAAIIRLDAFAYAPKAPGSHNFMNEPETWDTLEQVRKLAEPYGLTLLPEIHASYEEKTYEKVAGFGYLTYDFFLPGLLIDAIEQKDGTTLANWANELIDKDIHTVNMLGCHDGIPLLDLRGLLSGRTDFRAYRLDCRTRRICKEPARTEECVLSSQCHLLQCLGRR